MKDIVIFGAGGFGREVAFLIEEINKREKQFNILGFIDDNPNVDKKIGKYDLIGGSKYLLNYEKELGVAIAVGSAKVRKIIHSKIKENSNLFFPNLISPDTIISDSVKLGKGAIICFSNILTVDIKIGDFFISNLDCTIGHDDIIEDYVTLYPSVNISGNVKLSACCEIGTGTNIIQGKIIGENSIIGAGSVVVKDIPDNCTAVGAPAKPIKYFK